MATYFTYDPVVDDNGNLIVQSDEAEEIKEEEIESIESIEQPPFFRTAEINRTLFPSKYYKIPSKPCIIEEPLDFSNYPNRHFSMVKKDNSKKICFIGVDAVVYNDNQPTTTLQPLTTEECEAIFNKTEREAVTVVEDEETRRNDSLLEYFDELDDDSDIPVSQLRQYLHSAYVPSSMKDPFYEDNSDTSSVSSSNEFSTSFEEMNSSRFSRPTEIVDTVSPTERVNKSVSTEGVNKSVSTEGVNKSVSTEGVNKSVSIERVNKSISTEGVNKSIPSNTTSKPSLYPDTTNKPSLPSSHGIKKKSGPTKVYTPKVFSFDMIPDSPESSYQQISPASPEIFSDSSYLNETTNETQISDLSYNRYTPPPIPYLASSSQDNRRYEQSFPPFGITPVNEHGKIENIPITHDSLSEDDDFLGITRLSLTDIAKITTERSKTFKAENLRSPRLSDSQPSSLHTPRCFTGPVGAACISNENISFFLSVDTTTEVIETADHHNFFDFSSPIIRRISLTDRANNIHSFCRHTNDKLIRFQKRLSNITREEEKILDLFDLIGEGYNKNDQIEYKQQEIHQQLKQIATEESDYRILKDGYRKTVFSIQQQREEEKTMMMKQLECYGWIVTCLDAKKISLRFPFQNDCSFSIDMTTTNWILIHSTWKIQENDCELFKRIVAESELYDTLRYEIKYHELYDYFHQIWYICMKIKDEYFEKLL